MYSRAAGVELSGNWQVAPAWRLSAAVGGERVSYETFLGEGNMYSTQVGLAHALGRATLLRADGVFRREAVEREAYSWREFIVGAVGHAGASQGVRGDRGIDLQVAALR